MTVADRHALSNVAHVESLQSQLVDLLQRATELAHAPPPLSSSQEGAGGGAAGLFSRVLMIISPLRDLSAEYRRMVTSEEGRTELSDELQREILEILGIF